MARWYTYPKMSQIYQKSFARVYNLRWADFARSAAPALRDFYETASLGNKHRAVLDLCCGTGQLAKHFLEHNYQVIGLDASEHMLAYARENNAAYIVAGDAIFVQGDATDFSFENKYGLIVSTFDALNHLVDFQALKSCFQCVYPVLMPGGYFVFDLNTRSGLQRWNSIAVDERSEEIFLVTRGIYSPEMERAWTRISGFIRLENGLYEHFEETAFNTVYELQSVHDALIETGWRNVHFARLDDLHTPLEDPESEGRVFIVAHK